jgi:predicted GNAT family acetyltransferase
VTPPVHASEESLRLQIAPLLRREILELLDSRRSYNDIGMSIEDTGNGLEMHFVGSVKDLDTESGNPWHDPHTGKFSDGPPGVKMISGQMAMKSTSGKTKRGIESIRQQLVKQGLSPDMMAASGPDQNGMVRVTFLHKGTIVSVFRIHKDTGLGEPQQPQQGDGTQKQQMQQLATGLQQVKEQKTTLEQALKDFTTNPQINEALKSGNTQGWESDIEAIDAAMKPLPAGQTLYRGVGLDELGVSDISELENIDTEDPLELPTKLNYTSASLSKKIASTFNDVIVEFDSTGLKGIDIGKSSTFAAEKEILLQRGIKWTITGYDPDDNVAYAAVEIDQGESSGQAPEGAPADSGDAKEPYKPKTGDKVKVQSNDVELQGVNGQTGVVKDDFPDDEGLILVKLDKKNQTIGALPEELVQADTQEWPALTDLKTIGNAGGTTGAKIVQDSQGNKYIAKRGSPQGGDAHLLEEDTADSILAKAGELELLGENSGVPESKLFYDDQGKPVKLAKFVEGITTLMDAKNAGKTQQVQVLKEDAKAGFAVQAWIANWDSIGIGGDNVGVSPDGKLLAIDNGGALRFRAQGKKKGSAFGSDVGELESLRDPNMNSDAAGVYGSLTDEDVANQINAMEPHVDALLDNVTDQELSLKLQDRFAYMANWADEKLKDSDAKFKEEHGLGPNVQVSKIDEGDPAQVVELWNDSLFTADELIDSMKGWTAADVQKHIWHSADPQLKSIAWDYIKTLKPGNPNSDDAKNFANGWLTHGSGFPTAPSDLKKIPTPVLESMQNYASTSQYTMIEFELNARENFENKLFDGAPDSIALTFIATEEVVNALFDSFDEDDIKHAIENLDVDQKKLIQWAHADQGLLDQHPQLSLIDQLTLPADKKQKTADVAAMSTYGIDYSTWIDSATHSELQAAADILNDLWDSGAHVSNFAEKIEDINFQLGKKKSAQEESAGVTHSHPIGSTYDISHGSDGPGNVFLTVTGYNGTNDSGQSLYKADLKFKNGQSFVDIDYNQKQVDEFADLDKKNKKQSGIPDGSWVAKQPLKTNVAFESPLSQGEVLTGALASHTVDENGSSVYKIIDQQGLIWTVKPEDIFSPDIAHVKQAFKSHSFYKAIAQKQMAKFEKEAASTSTQQAPSKITAKNWVDQHFGLSKSEQISAMQKLTPEQLAAAWHALHDIGNDVTMAQWTSMEKSLKIEFAVKSKKSKGSIALHPQNNDFSPPNQQAEPAKEVYPGFNVGDKVDLGTIAPSNKFQIATVMEPTSSLGASQAFIVGFEGSSEDMVVWKDEVAEVTNITKSTDTGSQTNSELQTLANLGVNIGDVVEHKQGDKYKITGNGNLGIFGEDLKTGNKHKLDAHQKSWTIVSKEGSTPAPSESLSSSLLPIQKLALPKTNKKGIDLNQIEIGDKINAVGYIVEPTKVEFIYKNGNYKVTVLGKTVSIPPNKVGYHEKSDGSKPKFVNKYGVPIDELQPGHGVKAWNSGSYESGIVVEVAQGKYGQSKIDFGNGSKQVSNNYITDVISSEETAKLAVPAKKSVRKASNEVAVFSTKEQLDGLEAKGIDEDEIKSLFDSKVLEGLGNKIHVSHSVSASGGLTEHSFLGEIYDANGNKLGQVGHAIDYGAGTASLQHFEMNEQLWGKGIAKDMFRSQLEHFTRTGVKSATMMATGRNSSKIPLYGFDWASPSDKKIHTNAAKESLKSGFDSWLADNDKALRDRIKEWLGTAKFHQAMTATEVIEGVWDLVNDYGHDADVAKYKSNPSAMPKDIREKIADTIVKSFKGGVNYGIDLQFGNDTAHAWNIASENLDANGYLGNFGLFKQLKPVFSSKVGHAKFGKAAEFFAGKTTIEQDPFQTDTPWIGKLDLTPGSPSRDQLDKYLNEAFPAAPGKAPVGAITTDGFPIIHDVVLPSGAGWTESSDAWNKQNYANWFYDSNLTAAEKSAAKSFHGSGYGAINSHLRGFSDGGQSMVDKIKALTNAFKKAPRINKDVVLWRKISSANASAKALAEEFKTLQPGERWVDHGFQSTSTNKGTWGGDIQFKFYVPKGARGLSGEYYSSSHDGPNAGEYEVTMDRGSVWEYLGIEDGRYAFKLLGYEQRNAEFGSDHVSHIQKDPEIMKKQAAKVASEGFKPDTSIEQVKAVLNTYKGDSAIEDKAKIFAQSKKDEAQSSNEEMLWMEVLAKLNIPIPSWMNQSEGGWKTELQSVAKQSGPQGFKEAAEYIAANVAEPDKTQMLKQLMAWAKKNKAYHNKIGTDDGAKNPQKWEDKPIATLNNLLK